MSDLIFTDSNDSSKTLSSLYSKTPTPPPDRLDAPKRTRPNTIFYLDIRTPHTNTWTYLGPTRTFAPFLPTILAHVSAHPRALSKWTALKQRAEELDTVDNWIPDGSGGCVLEEKPTPFAHRGFSRFVVQHEEYGLPLDGQFTVLRAVRRVDAQICEMLPGGVYTVTSHGPLAHEVVAGRLGGFAATSRVVGSFATPEEARAAAHRVMDGLVEGERAEDVRRCEEWERLGVRRGRVPEGRGGTGRGVLMGMTGEKMWEVRVDYESDVLLGAAEKLNEDEERVAAGKEARWRVGRI